MVNIVKMYKIVLLILVLLAVDQHVFACTNILVSKGATTDGSTMITYAADAHFLYGELYHFPAQKHPEGATKKIYEWDSGKLLGEIPEARETYSVVGNINEFQVTIGETTYGGRPELVDTTGVMDYGSLMYTALQRSKTAREAIYTIDRLANEYGYYSSGESFSIADPNEVWIMEMIGKGTKMVETGKGKNKQQININKGMVWVAMRLPDGAICAHANQARITTFPKNDPENCLYSEDVIEFAREMGYYDGSDDDFSFSDTYAPLNFEGARFCEARVYSVFRKVQQGMEKHLDYAMGNNLEERMPLFAFPEKKLNVKDVMELMRDYYQGTPMDMTQDLGAGPFSSIVRWRPLVWMHDSAQFFNERAISTQQTGFSFVSQMRDWLPGPIGGILWFGVDDTYSTVYSPMYCGIYKVPEGFAEGNGHIMEFSENSAFWVFNQVSNFAYTRYNLMVPEIRQRQSELEGQYIAYTPAVDSAALLLHSKSPQLAREFLTHYSAQAGNLTVSEWKKLYHYLFVKYMDGNIKYKVEGQKFPKVEHPGYSEQWYQDLIKATGEKFKIRE
jgi:dipeptidase